MATQGRKMLAILFAVCLFFAPAASGLSKAYADYTPPFELTTQGVYLVNLDSDKVIYAKNETQRMYPASLTKILSAIVILENVDDLDATTATAQQWMFDEFWGLNISNAGMQAGETMTMRQLLYCMLMQSANECANVAAYQVGGESIPRFIDMMNETAKKIGAVNSHFVNPHGLHDDNHYSTPYDMYLIARYAMNLPGFMEIVSESVYYLEATNMVGQRTLVNTNHMMSTTMSDGRYYYAPVEGIKTGTTPEAGRCVVTKAQSGGMNYLCVMMGAPYYDADGNITTTNNAFVETKELYEWVFSTFGVKVLLERDEPVEEVPLHLAWDKDYLLLIPERSFSALVPKDIDPESVQTEVVLPEDGVTAPVKRGDVVGSVRLILAGEQIGEVNLVAADDVERSDWLFFLEELKKFFTSAPFWICVGVFVFAIVCYILYVANRNRRRNNRGRYKRSKMRKRF